MKLRRLQVQDFGCIASADVSFGPGLTVLFGPNDLGKTTLKRAIQAALLLQTGSSAAREFVPWGTDRNPTATLTFELDERLWRVRKVWSTGTGRSASLEWSNDGSTFCVAEEGRGVDGELRRLLGWGIAEPGGRGGTKGFPKSFLRSVLLGEQALPYSVLDDSLEGDADDSGRQRLTDALQAMATDEVYQKVLDRTQAHVDEAFTGTGKKKSGRDSPFRRVADEIARREELAGELERKVTDSEAVARRLAELDAERDRRFTEKAEANERLERLQADLRLQKQREAKRGDVEAARAVIEELERNQAEIARLSEEQRALEGSLPQLRAQAEQAQAGLREAQTQVDRATEQCRSVGEGGSSQDRVQEQRLVSRRVELQAELQGLERVQERAEACAAAIEDARKAEHSEAKAIAAVGAAEARLGRARAQAEACEREHLGLEAARAWLHRDELEAAVEASERAVRESSRLHEEAARLRDKAGQIQDDVRARGLPDAEGLASLLQVEQNLRLAEARLGGGVSVRLVAKRPVESTARVDGGAAASWSGEPALQGRREVVVELPEVGTLTVVGGEADARQAAEQARAAWEAEVAPALQRAGAEDPASLRAAAEQASAELASAASAQRQAQNLEQLAATHDETAQALPRRQSELVEHDRRIDAMGSAEVVEQGRRLAVELGDDDALRGRMEDLHERRGEAVRQVDDAKSELSEAKAAARVGGEQVDRARARVEQARAALDGDPKRILEDVSRRREALTTELGSLDRAQAELEEQRSGALQRAREALDAAEQRLHVATREHEEATRSLADRTEALSQARGALQVRREQASRSAPLAAAEAFARLEDELAALPKPTREVTDEDVAQAEAELDEAERALSEALSEVRMQEGALQQVGGTVVRERAETAREALEAARHREAEVELEYEGWRVLLETLREAHNEEGHHLGRALGRQISERFGLLTQGRYGTLQMGPALQTETLQTTAGPQRIDSLSEGLKEQLATILRVCVAEHLEGALILDDHLTQTDPARVAWFRDLLRTASGRGQIIVFTCRPADYLCAPEMPTERSPTADPGERLHVVDLERAIAPAQSRQRTIERP